MRRQACAILGVSEFATEEEIKTAYRALVKQYHPDTGNTQNTQYYQNVVQAYEYLKEHPTPEYDRNQYGMPNGGTVPYGAGKSNGAAMFYGTNAPYGNGFSYDQTVPWAMQASTQVNYGMYQRNSVSNQGMYAQGEQQNQWMPQQNAAQNQTPPRTGKVVGGSSNNSSHFSYASSREYAQFEKGYQQRRKERQVAFNEYMKQEKKRQEEYENAMEAIRHIKMAEALKAMIRSEQ